LVADDSLKTNSGRWKIENINNYSVLSVKNCLGTIIVPAGAVNTHPHWDAAGIVEFHSSIKGIVNFAATFTDLDGGSGNGISWFVGKNGTQISSGTLDNGTGNSVSFSQSVKVSVGDILYVGVGPRDGDYGWDNTGLNIVVSRPPEGAPFGPQGHGCGLTK
jgi:hypothetical protein